jgi:hypothetical protein
MSSRLMSVTARHAQKHQEILSEVNCMKLQDMKYGLGTTDLTKIFEPVEHTDLPISHSHMVKFKFVFFCLSEH